MSERKDKRIVLPFRVSERVVRDVERIAKRRGIARAAYVEQVVTEAVARDRRRAA